MDKLNLVFGIGFELGMFCILWLQLLNQFNLVSVLLLSIVLLWSIFINLKIYEEKYSSIKNIKPKHL